MEEENIINWPETLTLCNNSEALAKELLSMLAIDLPRQKMILIDTNTKTDLRLMRDILHQILGSCSYLSLPTIKQKALDLQNAIHTNEEQIDPEFKALIKAIDEVIMQASNHR